DLARDDADLRGERTMHGAFIGDLHDLRRLLGVEVALERDLADDLVDHAGLGLALGAVPGVDLLVLQPDENAAQRPALALDIHADGHRGAGAERRQQILVGIGAGIVAAHRYRLVGRQAMLADDHVLRVGARAAFLDYHLAHHALPFA